MTFVQRLHALPVGLVLTSCAAHDATQAQATMPNAPTSASPSNSAPVTKPAAIPDALATPAGERVVLKALGKGVQIYSCRPKEGTPSTFEWTLKAPDAELFDDGGKKIGKHYAGPTWEAADGSKVVGKLAAKADAPEPSAIPWLLLDAKSNEGEGLLARVKNIQRVATVGGKAPATGCDATHAGGETRVDYEATYYMYAP